MDNLQLSQGGSMAFASGALANGTTAGTIKTAAAIPFTIDGQFYSKAITDNISLAMTVPAVWSNGMASNGSFTGMLGGSTRLYGAYLDAAGAVSYVPGQVVNSTDLANGLAPLQFPPNKRGAVCFGCVRVAVTAGTTFIPGATALNAAGVTTTFLNLSGIPGEPLKA